MKKISKIFLVLLLSVSSQNSWAVSKSEPSKFFVKEGKHLQLCRDVKKILDDPENKRFAEPFISSPHFNIPKKYKDFALPKWEIVAMEDWSKYISPDSALAEYIGKLSEEEKPELKIHKANIDLDRDGKREVVLHVEKYGKREVERQKIFEHPSKETYYVADVDAQTRTSKEFNKKHAHEWAYLFYYKGLIYRIIHPEPAFLFIDTPKLGSDFYMLPTCIMSLTPEEKKKRSKALHEFNKTR